MNSKRIPQYAFFINLCLFIGVTVVFVNVLMTLHPIKEFDMTLLNGVSDSLFRESATLLIKDYNKLLNGTNLTGIKDVF